MLIDDILLLTGRGDRGNISNKETPMTLLECCQRLDYSPDQPRDENGRFGEGSGTHKDPVVRGMLEKLVGQNYGPRHAEFVRALENSSYDSTNPAHQGAGPHTVETHISTSRAMGDKSPNVSATYQQWEHAVNTKEAKEKAEEWKKNSVAVREISKSGKFGKEERVSLADRDKPWVEGTRIHEESSDIRGRDFDTDRSPQASFKLITYKVGTDIQAGRIVAARQLSDGNVQYAVRDRTPIQEKSYQKALAAESDQARAFQNR
jgi:hypothetical protein